MVTTGSTTSTTTSAGSSIVTALGSGSGVDTASLVTSLVEAQFALKTRQLTAKADALTTQISAVAKLKSGINDFDAALRTLVKGGTLSAQPTSSNVAIKATALPGATIGALSGTIRVDRLATAQAATTDTAVPRTAAFRPGTFSLRFGSETTTNGITGFTPGDAPAVSIDITAADATLDGIAARINAAKAGVTASVVNDGTGARLTIKGATGAARAFELTGTDTDPSGAGMGLATLNVGRDAPGTTIGTSAGDAIVTLDGASFARASNGIDDLVTGVKLELSATGTTTLGSTPATAAVSQAVADFVETFNQLQKIVREDIDPVNGVLRGDTTSKELSRGLGRLTTARLVASAATGVPATLADIGVKTNRDGTLSIDTARLNKVMTSNPASVEAMFAYGAGAATDGLSGVLGGIAKQLAATAINNDRNKDYGFDTRTLRYNAALADIATAQTKASDEAAAMKTRLTAQFAKMDAAVAAYKSTQSFLKSQVDAWNRSGN